MIFHSQKNKTPAVNITPEMVKFKNAEESDYKHTLVFLENCLKQKNKKADPAPGSQVAASGGYNSLQGQRMDVVGSQQTKFTSSNNYINPQQKKTMLECATVQMPQSLLNELSNVLTQTGRKPREDS